MKTVPMDPESPGPRIRAYLASMRPGEGDMRDDIEKAYHRGRGALERLAVDCDTEGDLVLSPTECADVLIWMTMSDPIDSATWWTKEGRVSHVCGFRFVLDAMADSLREAAAS